MSLLVRRAAHAPRGADLRTATRSAVTRGPNQAHAQPIKIPTEGPIAPTKRSQCLSSGVRSLDDHKRRKFLARSPNLAVDNNGEAVRSGLYAAATCARARGGVSFSLRCHGHNRRDKDARRVLVLPSTPTHPSIHTHILSHPHPHSHPPTFIPTPTPTHWHPPTHTRPVVRLPPSRAHPNSPYRVHPS